MTLDDQIAWLADEAVRRLRQAANRNKRAADDRARAAHYKPAADWYMDNAHRKEVAGVRLRAEAATLLTIENTLRAMRDGVTA